MILQALHDLYGRLESEPGYGIAPPDRSYQKVTFVVVLDPDGTLVNIQDARSTGGRHPAPRRVLVLGQTKPPGSGLNPCTLWDAPGYLLGFDAKRPQRGPRTFKASRDHHLALEAEVGVPEFSAVCRFLEAWEPARCSTFPILDEVGTGFGVFQIRGQTRYVHEHPSIAAWWDRRAPGQEPGPEGQCLVTGEIRPIARIQPKVKGVAAAQPSGATIAGFDDHSFWSYGLKQSFNAPVSEEAARRYVIALNALLEGPRRDKHRAVVGHTTVAFWTDRPTATEDIFLAFAAEGSSALARPEAQDETVRAKLGAFVKALRRGREAYGELQDDLDATEYFILGLAAPTPARVAVRFFHRGTLAELLENVRRHHRDIGIERRFGDDAKRPEPEFPSVGFLLDETCPRHGGKADRDKIPPLLAGTLLEAVVTGGRYPEGLFRSVVRRIGADRAINYARACVIKGYLVRSLGKEIPVSLDPTRNDPAYRLGRLFAALEKTQLEALESLSATIRDRFFSSASATPAVVFPRLLRTYQHHLAKLQGGHRVNRERLVQEILEPLTEFPAHLPLPEQGVFDLGYYHQMNAFYTKKSSDTEAPAA